MDSIFIYHNFLK